MRPARRPNCPGPKGEAPPEARVGALLPAIGRQQRKRMVEVSKSVLEGGGGQRPITGQHEEANAPVGGGGGSRQQQLIGDVRGSFGQLPGEIGRASCRERV